MNPTKADIERVTAKLYAAITAMTEAGAAMMHMPGACEKQQHHAIEMLGAASMAADWARAIKGMAE